MDEHTNSQRLDLVLVARGLVSTRSRARDLVLRGLVRVDGLASNKPSELVGPGQDIALAVEADGNAVSRGAEKLRSAIAHFGYEARDRIILDIGASTGGFTQVLLEHGAGHVYAVDVGRDQLHPRLRADPRVTSMEHYDARSLTRSDIDGAIGGIVADVSFISLTKALSAALSLAAPRAWLIALIKPQFELDPKSVGRGGIVRDASAHERAVASVRTWLAAQPDWRVAGVIPSPIAGGSGNREFLIGARHEAATDE